MSDKDNSKVLSNNSKTLSQKVCKCGNAIADLLGRIDGFSENLGRVKFGESPHVLRTYEESANYVYGGLRTSNHSVILIQEKNNNIL